MFSKLGLKGSIDCLSVSPRSVSDETLKSLFTKKEDLKSNNTVLYNSQTASSDDILRYNFKSKTATVYKKSHDSEFSAYQNFDGDFKGLLPSNDKAVLYIKGEDTTDDFRVIYRPHFR